VLKSEKFSFLISNKLRICRLKKHFVLIIFFRPAFLHKMTSQRYGEVSDNDFDTDNKRVEHRTMMTRKGVEVHLHIFLISAVAGGEWSASSPGRFAAGERPLTTNTVGCWVIEESRRGANESSLCFCQESNLRSSSPLAWSLRWLYRWVNVGVFGLCRRLIFSNICCIFVTCYQVEWIVFNSPLRTNHDWN
jgi:hypothetical protein